MTTDAMSRRDAMRLLACGLGAVACSPSHPAVADQGAAPPRPSLKAKFANDFAVGVALGGDVPTGYAPDELALVRDHFAVVTPADCMKMDPVQRAEGAFDFRRADAFVAFAEEHGLSVVGHTLVWARDDVTPPWVFADGDRPASREMVLNRMRRHVEALAGRYRGRIAQWDVVNEALADDEGGYLRPSKWQEVVGPEFVARAFEYAHAAAPDAVLIYNDYLTESPAKRERMLRLLRALLEQRVPVHAVGLQGHFELDRVPLKELDATLDAIRGLGLKAMITELDLAVVSRERWYADGGRHREEVAKWNPYEDGCPPDVLARQAAQYGDLFQLFRKHAEVIDRVTFWDLHDGRSWLNDFPWKHAEHPLLFDRRRRPKPALDAVLEVK